VSDVLISGDTAYRAPPNTIEVNLEPAPASEQVKDADDVRLRRIEGPTIHVDETGSELREEIRRRREGTEEPIVEWRAGDLDPAGEHEGHHKQIKRASEALFNARQAATAKYFQQYPSVTEEQSHIAAEAVASMPPVKVVPVGDEGRPIQPLRDDQPITELDSFRNMNEAKRGMSQYRDWVEREQTALLNDLMAREQQQNAEVQAPLNAPTAPEPAPPSPPPEIERERAQVVEQQRRLAVQQYWQNLSNAEREAAQEAQDIRDWLPAAYAQDELRNPTLIADPQRRGWLATAVDKHNALLGQLQQSQQIRNAAVVQANQAQAARAAQFGKQADDQFNDWLAREHPQYASGRARQELMEVAKSVVSPAIAESYKRGGEARSLEGQKLIAESAMWRLAQKRAREIPNKRAPVPPVQRPGVYRPAGADAEADVGRLQRELDNAPTQRAQLAIARKLTQAKRAAGQL
jgi:hypothetical protein